MCSIPFTPHVQHFSYSLGHVWYFLSIYSYTNKCTNLCLLQRADTGDSFPEYGVKSSKPRTLHSKLSHAWGVTERTLDFKIFLCRFFVPRPVPTLALTRAYYFYPEDSVHFWPDVLNWTSLHHCPADLLVFKSFPSRWPQISSVTQNTCGIKLEKKRSFM